MALEADGWFNADNLPDHNHTTLLEACAMQ